MEGFEDLLEDIKKIGGPLLWITQKKEFLENIFIHQKRTPEQIKMDVLHSPRLNHVIEQLLNKEINKSYNLSSVKKEQKIQNTLPMIDTNSDTIKTVLKLRREELEKEARAILDEMGHSFNLKYVRFVGFLVIKVLTSIYQHIYYNRDLVTNLQVIKHHPTILLPLHRSYMDFIIASIICFHKNIQLPAIAAGQDFLGLSFVSELLRRCGAFFIRRSFGSDELYWAIFHQYVQEHLLGCDRPVEFFIEGTRSRTSKSLQPKQGMLATCVELFMKGHRCEDIYFIPVSLTYDKLLEEMLYSNELLGIPKPKESVSGLVKARSILNQTYGSIFVNFSRPISLREMLNQIEGPNLRNRLSHTLTPSFIFDLKKPQLKSIESLSYLLLIEMSKNQVIQPMSIMTTCILLSFKQNVFESVRSIRLDDLCVQIDNLKRILVNLGVKVYWPLKKISNMNDSNENHNELNRLMHLILDNIEIHDNLFNLYEENDPNWTDTSAVKFKTNLNLARKQNIIENTFVLSVKQPHLIETTNTSLFESVSIYLAVCSYRNQLVNFLVRISLTVNCLLASESNLSMKTNQHQLLTSLNETKAFESFKMLCRLFNREFIFHAGDELKDFNDSISYLLHTNLLKVAEVDQNGQRKFELITFNLKQLFFFALLFQSIIENSLELYDILLIDLNNQNKSNKIEFTDEKAFLKKVQQQFFDKMVEFKKNPNLNANSSDKNGYLFDYEILSLNSISNALLTLKQFDILRKIQIDDFVERKFSFEIDLILLNSLNDRLKNIIKINKLKLNWLNQFSKTIESGSISKTPISFNSSFDLNDYFMSDYDESDLIDKNVSHL
jgi:glycerone phosphate O-acyltransferase